LAGLTYDEVDETVLALGVPKEMGPAFWNVVRENITVLNDMADWWTLFRDGATPTVAAEDKAFIAEAFSLLPAMPYGPSTWSEWTALVKEKTGRKGKALFMPLRLALTGKQRGPEMADVMALLQKPPTI